MFFSPKLTWNIKIHTVFLKIIILTTSLLLAGNRRTWEFSLHWDHLSYYIIFSAEVSSFKNLNFFDLLFK